ncbi:MAG: peptide chain release factor N(5)-glutamine methyltransferase [SAR86 cluster bacterium]|jgi:release factor glutamine methyltransferase|nr:peptide chain release factor N(5)-glutamine methyltransferase [SAR86 cluster bacterium]
MRSGSSSVFMEYLEFAKNSNYVEALDVENIFSHILGVSRSSLYTNKFLNINKTNLNIIKQSINRRNLGEPLAYILEKKGFWNIELSVNKHVLVPRPETETLVEIVLDIYGQESIQILDAGTGSGAISLALAHERKEWKVFALEKSYRALKVAKQNEIDLGIEINLIQGDWLSSIKKGSLDVVVSNPPYIFKNDPRLLGDGVRFEPLNSLVSNKNGLEDIQKIVEESSYCLRKKGMLFLEHSPEQKNIVKDIFNNFSFEDYTSYKDLNGDDRISRGIKI